jgi:hypothetical protein
MTGSTRIVAAAAIAMMLSGCDWLIEPEPDIIYLVPEQFAGWMCVDFDVKTAPPLPRENSEPIRSWTVAGAGGASHRQQHSRASLMPPL